MKNKKNIMLILLVAAVTTCCYASEAKNEASDGWIEMKNGLTYRVITEGSGEVAVKGDTVSVHYTGTFVDGKKFDSSVDRGKPFEFQIGAGSVIEGWELGVAGMKAGEKRILQIPSKLAYGKKGAGNIIPPDTNLVFEVELLGIKKAKK